MEEPDEGSVTRANHVVVRFLSQQPVFEPEDTILESVLKGNEKSLSVGRGSDEEKGHGEWELESQAKSMLTRLGVTDFGQKCGELSGGQKKRLALVATLLMPADILILDEPTNHLDNSMADWLEDYLKKWKGALIMVTHDRYLMQTLGCPILYLEDGKAEFYANFEALKTARPPGRKTWPPGRSLPKAGVRQGTAPPPGRSARPPQGGGNGDRGTGSPYRRIGERDQRPRSAARSPAAAGKMR